MFRDELKSALSNVNKADLAKDIKCHRDTIAKMMRGDMAPNVSILLRICRALFGDEWDMAYIRWSIMIDMEKEQLDNLKQQH